MRLSTRKPERRPYPKTLETWGDHIRQRRLDQGLLQREAAEQLGCCAAALHNWERNRTQPKVYLLPRIIDFLGYVPSKPATSFPEALRIARRSAGLSQEQLALRAGVDESSIAKWERGETIPFPATVKRLRRFFNKMDRSLPEFRREAFLRSRATCGGSAEGMDSASAANETRLRREPLVHERCKSSQRMPSWSVASTKGKPRASWHEQISRSLCAILVVVNVDPWNNEEVGQGFI